MATILITTKPRYMPDEENPGKWQTLPEAEGFYYQDIGSHHIFLHECLPKDGKKLKPKHTIVASWVDTVISYSNAKFNDFCFEDFYLIAHDEDLLRFRKNDEGLLREDVVISVGGGA